MKPDKRYQDIQSMLGRAQRILLTSHVGPDGDNIGSMLGLGRSLELMGKDVMWYLEDKVPDDYLFLAHASRIQQYSEDGEGLSAQHFDLAICVDTSVKERMGKSLEQEIDRLAIPLINIDHHITNEGFGDVSVVVSQAAATGEIIFDLLQSLHMPIDKDIASALYVAIVTDTGGFQYDSVTSHTLRTAATLVDYGAQVGPINVCLYQKKSIARERLHQLVMETLQFYEENKIAVVHSNLQMMEATQTLSEDTEGIIEQVRALAPVEIAVLLKEKQAKVWKVSMRSKMDANVSRVAQKFGGGGHVKAAGCTLYGELCQVKTELLDAIREELNA